MNPIKITDLIKQCTINDSDMQEVLNAHPKQFIGDCLEVPVWRVNYTYTTARGNKKEAVKYIFRQECQWDCIEYVFERYIDKQNEKHPDRKLSNVKILDTEYLGELNIELE